MRNLDAQMFEKGARVNGRGRGRTCWMCASVIATGQRWHRRDDDYAHVACLEKQFRKLRKSLALEVSE